MPHARQALHIAGEDIHVALWPSVKEMHQIASRHYAFEGRCFVVAAGGIMRSSDLPAGLELGDNVPAEDCDFIMKGGSCVIGPDGQYVAGPAFGSEVIILARINLERIREESLALDVTGHFNRPDLFDFRFNGSREAVNVEALPADEDDLVQSTEVLLPASSDVLSGADAAPALRVVKPARTPGYESEIHDLEKQIG
jgi:hypothetical protein